jgi:peptide deformylase
VKLLDIRVLGDPVLRRETTPVHEITDELRELVADMFATMYAAEGIGLAAPQVGRMERVAVVDAEGTKLVLINPQVLEPSGSARAEEGCLSIPEIYGDVTRPETVVLRATDIEGNEYELEATELLARCIQHEVDHLHGKLFIDYLGLFKRRSALAEWDKKKDQYPNCVRRVVPGAEQRRDSDVADHAHTHTPEHTGEI